MEFFETFWVWLDARLISYVSANTHRLSAALTPAIGTLGIVYVMMWGYLQMSGKIEEPFSAGLQKIVTLFVVLGVSLHLWLYHGIIVDTFYNAPAQLAGAMVGASDPVHVIDTIWANGALVAEKLESRATWGTYVSFTIMAYVIRIVIGLLCVYTMFLIALAKVGLSVLLALGPLFIVMLLFEQTRPLFRSWIAQLSNYAFITILTVMVCALMLGIVAQYATDTLARGEAIHTVDALNLVLICVLAFLFMFQVPQIASGLATGGVPANTLGLGRAAARQMARPLTALGKLGARHTGLWIMSKFRSRGNDPEPRSDFSGASSQSSKRMVPRNTIESNVR